MDGRFAALLLNSCVETKGDIFLMALEPELMLAMLQIFSLDLHRKPSNKKLLQKFQECKKTLSEIIQTVDQACCRFMKFVKLFVANQNLFCYTFYSAKGTNCVYFEKCAF